MEIYINIKVIKIIFDVIPNIVELKFGFLGWINFEKIKPPCKDFPANPCR
jgi:hypothetical protein